MPSPRSFSPDLSRPPRRERHTSASTAHNPLTPPQPYLNPLLGPHCLAPFALTPSAVMPAVTRTTGRLLLSLPPASDPLPFVYAASASKLRACTSHHPAPANLAHTPYAPTVPPTSHTPDVRASSRSTHSHLKARAGAMRASQPSLHPLPRRFLSIERHNPASVDDIEYRKDFNNFAFSPPRPRAAPAVGHGSWRVSRCVHPLLVSIFVARVLGAKEDFPFSPHTHINHPFRFILPYFSAAFDVGWSLCRVSAHDGDDF
ncbi:hypothetical protein C8F04DRAFT_1258706 [Mycena alexandri]|uniref:Uncharacterized protein n=1 Tax=Mycena alexandri TaxID=1745969 RepID=A0AAD6X3Z0_9AGAR|nr:hypothetical protein C8F04DRAFT_1258706 [Mycena alexandri]